MNGPDPTRLRKRLKKRGIATKPAVPRIENALNRPFARLLAQKKSVPTLFCELVNKLGKWFSISKAALAIYDDQTGTLKLASCWDLDCFKEGILISLPTKDSLFHRVLHSDSIFHGPINGNFPGNYVEQRLMASGTTAALAICPLEHEGVRQGVIGLSSSVPLAFEMLEEGYFSAILDNLASLLAARNMDESWDPTFGTAWRNSDPADRQSSLSPLLDIASTNHNEIPKSRPDYRPDRKLDFA